MKWNSSFEVWALSLDLMDSIENLQKTLVEKHFWNYEWYDTSKVAANFHLNLLRAGFELVFLYIYLKYKPVVWYTLWTSTIEQYSDTNFESVFRYELETNTNYKPVWYELHTRYKLQTSILMQLWYPQGMMFLVFLVALTPVSCRDLMDKILSSKTWQSKHIFRFWHRYGKASKTWVQNYIYRKLFLLMAK